MGSEMCIRDSHDEPDHYDVVRDDDIVVGNDHDVRLVHGDDVRDDNVLGNDHDLVLGRSNVRAAVGYTG